MVTVLSSTKAGSLGRELHEIANQGRGPLGHGAAELGELDRALAAVDEGLAHLGLKGRKVAAGGGLTHANMLGGLGHATQLCY